MAIKKQNKMKNFPRIFPYQLIHNDDLKEKSNESFERGYRAGKRDAIESLRSIQAYDCRTLDEMEKGMVMRFLEYHNLEFGYNVDAGGFYVIKKSKLRNLIKDPKPIPHEEYLSTRLNAYKPVK